MLLVVFAHYYVIVVGLRFKRYTLYFFSSPCMVRPRLILLDLITLIFVEEYRF